MSKIRRTAILGATALSGAAFLVLETAARRWS